MKKVKKVFSRRNHNVINVLYNQGKRIFCVITIISILITLAVEANAMTYALSFQNANYGYSNVLTMRRVAANEFNNVSAVKASLNAMPGGQRTIIIDEAYIRNTISANVVKYIWWDNGRDQVASDMETFFTNLKNSGASLNYIITDCELGFSVWSHYTPTQKMSDLTPSQWDSITTDPRWTTGENVRQQLADNGFVFDSQKPDLYWVYNRNTAPEPYKNNYHIWNKVMRKRVAKYLNDAIYNVAKQSHLYPNVVYSEYNSYNISASIHVPDINGTRHYLGGWRDKAGNVGSISIYGRLKDILTNVPEGYTYSSQYNYVPFNSLQLGQYAMRGATASSTQPPMPWVADIGYCGDSGEYGGLGEDSNYYFENIFHAGLQNPRVFLYWGPYESHGDKANAVQKLSAALTELDNRTGGLGWGNGATPLTSYYSYDFNDRFLLTGLRITPSVAVNGYDAGTPHNIWRITCDNTALEGKPFKTQTEPVPVFKINHKQITFPVGSKIFYGGLSNGIGYWVTTPDGTYPTISSY